jgi:hypothetical protein
MLSFVEKHKFSKHLAVVMMQIEMIGIPVFFYVQCDGNGLQQMRQDHATQTSAPPRAAS